MFHCFVPLRDIVRSQRALSTDPRHVLIVVSVFVVLAAQGAHAQAEVPLTLAAAEDLALASEPGREALLARADALEEQSVVAGELPDPQLRVGLANYPLQAGGFSTEAMTQGQLGLRQSFPPGESRAASTRRFRSLATAMNASADARGRDVLTAVRQAWFEACYWGDAGDIVTESRPYFEDLATVTRSLYSVGRRDQQDVLGAELELSRLDDRLLEIEERRMRARAALSKWIGDAAYRPLAVPVAGRDALPAEELLRSALSEHPALRAADARIDARVADIEIAEERFKPGWALDIGYGYRDGMLPDGSPRSDFVSVSVTVDLPLFTRNRQSRSLRAAFAERRAADAERLELQRRLGGQLDAEYARWRQLNKRVALYESTILAQAEHRASATLAAYQSNAGDFADVMRGRIDALTARLAYVQLQSERAQSYAVLANLGGFPR